MRTKGKRPKQECEVCGEKNIKVLHRHHIIERKEIGTSNDDFNLAVICGNCHMRVHAGEIKIIGVFPSTKPPMGRTLVFEVNGIANIPGITEAYFHHKPKAMKVNIKD